MASSDLERADDALNPTFEVAGKRYPLPKIKAKQAVMTKVIADLREAGDQRGRWVAVVGAQQLFLCEQLGPDLRADLGLVGRVEQGLGQRRHADFGNGAQSIRYP